MILTKLKLHNFCQFTGNKTFEFDAAKKQNTTVLIGGGASGKTNILRAILFCLYGNSQLPKGFRPVSINALQENKQNGSNCIETFVELHLEHKGVLYELKRKIEANQYKDESIEETKTVKLILKRSDARPEIKTNPAEIDEIIASILDSRLKDYFLLEGDKIVDLSQTDVRKTLKAVGKELTKEIQGRVAQIATDLSKELLMERDQQHVSRITVSKDYSIEVTNEDGHSCFGILSAGERLVVSLCFVIALAKIIAGEDFHEMSFIMDSPFIRLTSEYRSQLVEKLPGLLNQWILIAHEAEVAKGEIVILKKCNRLNRTYVLEQISRGGSFGNDNLSDWGGLYLDNNSNGE